jgi:hypothetical protein
LIRAALGAVALLLAAAPAAAQDRVSLSIEEPCRPVAVAPGGEIVLRGAIRSRHDGAVIDALTTTTGEGADAVTAPGGLYDVEAGGFRLVSRDPAAHAYRLAATGETGPGCTEAAVASPCLPLRMLALSRTRLLAVADFARTLDGAITLEVLHPDDAPPPPPPPAAPGFLERHPLPIAGGLLLALIGALGVARVRRARSTPEGRVARAAARLGARLRGGDPVHRALLPSVDALASTAAELAALRDRLRAKVGSSGRADIEARRRELAARTDPESAEALRLVDEQLATIGRWSAEADRAGARIDRVLEYLRLLHQRFDEDARTAQDEADTRALAELERDVQAALEGAREADRLLR